MSSEKFSSSNVQEKLKHFADFLPPAIPYSCEEATQPPPLFYTNHVDPQLRLKRLEIIPSLHIDISKVFLQELDRVTTQELPLPPTTKFPFISSDLRDDFSRARIIADNYVDNLGFASQRIASVLTLLHGAETWPYLMTWTRGSFRHSENMLGFDEGFTPILTLDNRRRLPEQAISLLEPSVLSDLRAAQKCFPSLAVWQMFAHTPAIECIFKEMDALEGSSNFTWISWPASDDRAQLPHTSRSSIFDADEVFLKDLMGDCPTSQALTALPNLKSAEKHDSLRRSIRIRKGARDPEAHTPYKFDSYHLPLSNTCPNSGTDLPATAKSIIQHAWMRAVETDSTFIVLYAGNFERIGIRHRESQTLFLSKLIHATEAADGPYGALHVGLHMCILKDILNRIPRYIAYDKANRVASKHRARSLLQAGAPPPQASRRWTRSDTVKELKDLGAFKTMLKKTAHLNLLLLSFKDNYFCSPAPAAFLRVGGSRQISGIYKPEEYTTATLTKYISGGAIGEAHFATLNMFSDSHQTVSCDAVVKLAFTHAQRKKMRREFQVYRYLSSKNVSGVPLILGLFQDVETRALAMVMQDAGTAVVDPYHMTESERGGTSWHFTPEERAAFVKILKGIHSTGVRHRDIRPNNLMLTGSGRAYIIDFDKALLNSSEESRRQELEYLDLLMLGDYTAPHEVSTLERHPAGWVESSGPSSD